MKKTTALMMSIIMVFTLLCLAGCNASDSAESEQIVCEEEENDFVDYIEDDATKYDKFIGKWVAVERIITDDEYYETYIAYDEGHDDDVEDSEYDYDDEGEDNDYDGVKTEPLGSDERIELNIKDGNQGFLIIDNTRYKCVWIYYNGTDSHDDYINITPLIKNPKYEDAKLIASLMTNAEENDGFLYANINDMRLKFARK